MELSQEEHAPFQLFDSVGIGLIGLDEKHRIRLVNSNALQYLDLSLDNILGQEITALKALIPSPEFWDSFLSHSTFYCLMPSRNHLLLTIYRNFPTPTRGAFQKALLLRPFSLERDHLRMKSRLNQNLGLEINSRLNSIAIASEIILEPGLQEDPAARNRFLATFTRDVTDLSQLFSELEETTAPLPIPIRVHRTRLDWKSLVLDLVSKMRGLAREKSVSLINILPPRLPSPLGDYHWLYLAFFGVLHHSILKTAPLGEISLTCRETAGKLETTIHFSGQETTSEVVWPPPALFPLPDEDPGISKMELSELAISRSIFLLHQGDLQQEEKDSHFSLRVILPS